jgi:hypothetical protein
VPDVVSDAVFEAAGRPCPDAESEVADDDEADEGADGGASEVDGVGAVSEVGAVVVAPDVAVLGGLVLDVVRVFSALMVEVVLPI